jgi:hypothetical protein
MSTYYEAFIGRASFEAPSLRALKNSIVNYYLDGDSERAPEVTAVTIHENDGESLMDSAALKLLNREIADEFDEALAEAIHQMEHHHGLMNRDGR